MTSKTSSPKDEKSDLPPPLQTPKKALTILYNDLPEWMRDNHYIRTGYRPASNSYHASLLSLLHLHNESVNIHTHLLGSVLALIIGTSLYFNLRPRYEQATPEDVGVFACFFGGAMGCLGMSATYHTISNHSEEVARWGNRLDYMGIVVLIWGSFVPSIYYGFSGEPRLVRVYWTMITTISAGTLVVVLYPKFRTKEWRPVRAAMFAATGLSAIVPVIHGLQMYGYKQLEEQMGLSWVVLQGASYLSGAAIYAARIPERFRPGMFDIWGNSHQIFHVLVLVAAAAHLVGLLKAFDYEHSHRMTMMSSYTKLPKFPDGFMPT